MTAAPGRDLTERLDPYHVKPPVSYGVRFT